MTVDDQAIRDRVAPFIPPGSPTATLREQLHSGMGDLRVPPVAGRRAAGGPRRGAPVKFGKAAPSRCSWVDPIGNLCRRPRGHEPLPHVVADHGSKRRMLVYRVRGAVA